MKAAIVRATGRRIRSASRTWRRPIPDRTTCAKHLRLQVGDDEWGSLRNTNQIRGFVGKVVKRITDNVFKVVRQRATALNVYTTEIRGDSKGIKTFYGKRLDFIDETARMCSC
jgi:hypothetical protein